MADPLWSADISDLYYGKKSTSSLCRLVSHPSPTKDLFMDPKFILTVCNCFQVKELALNPRFSVKVAEFEGWRRFLKKRGHGDILLTKTELPFVPSVRLVQIRTGMGTPIPPYLFYHMAPRCVLVKMPDGEIKDLQGTISTFKKELYPLMKDNYSVRDLVFYIESGPQLDSKPEEVDTIVARNKAIFQRRQQTTLTLLGLARFRKLPEGFERNLLKVIAEIAWAVKPKMVEGLLSKDELLDPK